MGLAESLPGGCSPVGSPDYLARHAALKAPRDLQHHDCIRNRLPNGTVSAGNSKRTEKRFKSLSMAA